MRAAIVCAGLVLASCFTRSFVLSTRITDEQWQMYFYAVQGAEGVEAQPLGAQHLIVFTDAAGGTSWVFTQMGHPAHPSWITRRIAGAGDSASIHQIVY